MAMEIKISTHGGAAEEGIVLRREPGGRLLLTEKVDKDDKPRFLTLVEGEEMTRALIALYPEVLRRV